MRGQSRGNEDEAGQKDQKAVKFIEEEPAQNEPGPG